LGASNPGRARAVYHHARVLHLPAGQMQGVEDSCRGDDRRPVLVIVKHRNVEQLLKLLLDDEALGCLDIFKIYATEAGTQEADTVDELVYVFGRHLQINSIDIGKAFEKNRLA